MKSSGTSRASVDAFFRQDSFALVGVSRDAKHFANAVFRALKERGKTVYPINPRATTVEGTPCVPSVSALPAAVGAVGIFVRPEFVQEILDQVHAAGIKNVWLQQGTESEQTVAFCRERGINVVAGECMLMFAEPVHGIHRFHRWVKEVTGGLA
jgi:predicted CoA-binding protein